MTTNLEKFKREMQPAKEIYTREIREFSRNYPQLGEMTVVEFPDIDVQEYIFEFEKVNGTSEKELEEILLEIYDHMEYFSKQNGISQFYQFASVWL